MDDSMISEASNLAAEREGETAVDNVNVDQVDQPALAVSPVSSENGQANGADAAAAPGGDALVDGASLMEQFLNDPSHDYKTLKYGDVMDGIVMHIDREELLVDIGSKSEGIVPAREYSSLTAEEKKALSVGDRILVFVVQPENQEGHAVVSIDRARQEKSWRQLQEKYEANEVIEAEVTNYNKGGLLVNLDGVRGFVPASQVSEIRGGDESSKQADMARLIGSSMPLKVIEINRHRNRLILSERQAVQERRDVMKERLIEELKEGEIRKGRVSSICDFGAFVDIGGADGLVHLSELSWSRVRHPSEILKVGQDVDVYVLGINAQEKKIALSIKRTQAEPWSRVAANYEVGQLVHGVVTQLANFGGFARIEDGIEGLIHVSELADERITHPKQVVREGQELLLRIIRIDPQRRRMGLSLRRALDTPDDELVAVFGPEVLEERDRLVQTIRQALEAEGIEPVERGAEDAEDGGADEISTEQPAAVADLTSDSEVAASGGSAVQPSPAISEESVEPATMASAGEPEPPTAARSGRKSRSSATPKQTAAVPDDEGGEPLSAMAMAFAMAGASDLATESAVEETEASDATATDAVPTPEAARPTAEAAGANVAAAESASVSAVDLEPTAGAESTPPAEDAASDADDRGSVVEIVESAAEAVANTVTSVAGAVATRVAGLAATILPGDSTETENPTDDQATTSDDQLTSAAGMDEGQADTPDAASPNDESETGADDGGAPAH